MLAFALCGVTACHDDDPVVSPEENVEEDFAEVFSPSEPDYASVAINAPVFISSSIKAEVREGLQTFLTNITSLEDAEVAVGGDSSPGIGYRGMGGTILITRGEVEATGDGSAAAIGGSTSGADNPCIFEAITITDGVKRLVLVKGSDCPRYIGNGKTEYDSGPVTLDGIEDPKPRDLFPHFESLIDNEVWTLLNHNR